MFEKVLDTPLAIIQIVQCKSAFLECHVSFKQGRPYRHFCNPCIQSKCFLYIRFFIRIVFRPPACNFIKKETLVQVFSYEFCEISINTFFTKQLWVTASGPLEDILDGNFGKFIFLQSVGQQK